MPKFTIDDILKIQQQPKHIRNISVIAHVDHGKTTLTETLNAGVTDFLEEEKDRGITIQSTAVSLYHKNENESTLINLIDSPGHVDFSSEVTAALRVTDGALVVVDCLEGVCVQTETVLRQAIGERIRPVLFLNKLDRIFLETKPDLEDAYKTLRNSIESVNVVCETYKDEMLGDISLSPQSGRVGFGSGLHGWGFTLEDFAVMYASKFGLKESKLMKRLWGNYYYASKMNKWLRFKNNRYYDSENKVIEVKEKLERSFVVFVLRPIKVLCDSIMNEEKSVYSPVIEALGLKFSKKELENVKKPKDYLKLVMQKWLPCGPTLIGMIKNHLPSPVDAQKYRIENLYTGNLLSKEANDIRTCNINGVMSMYVSKMVEYNGKFIGFGRVFSGKISSGSQIRIMADNYTESDDNKSNENEIKRRKINNLYLMMGKHTQPVPVCYAGSICSVAGIDDTIQKNGTLTDSEDMSPFKTMKFSVSAVVKYSVKPKNPKDLPKLLKGLRKLSKIDQIIQVYKTDNNENIIAGAGELHLEVSINRLKNEFLNNSVPIIKSEPIVSICESISDNTICNLKTDLKEPNLLCAKSPNRLNRVYLNAQPMTKEIISDIDNSKIDITNLKNKKAFSNLLSSNESYDFTKSDAQKIWTFGIGDNSSPNCLVDLTKGVQLINEIKPHCINSFMGVIKEGVLCKENLRGVRFNLKYAKIHQSREHRGANQIVPAIRKAFYGCQLASNPILLQPMYEIEINSDKSCEHKIISCLQQKEGYYTDTEYKIGSNIVIKGYLPVLKSFGITEFLRSKVGGKAYPQMCFSHWQALKGNPLEENSPANEILVGIRKRKDMNPKLPQLNDYFDRM